VLNADGEFVNPDAGGGTWQEAWKARAEKASQMSGDDILMAARGAGNVDKREGPESDKSKARRALAGCRTDKLREKAGAGTVGECTARVFGGEYDFMLGVL